MFIFFLLFDFIFFFFQAEDGIRDDLVTGVQTCALPILKVLDTPVVDRKVHTAGVELDYYGSIEDFHRFTYGTHLQFHVDGDVTTILHRSEERRVGKECRSRWSPYH